MDGRKAVVNGPVVAEADGDGFRHSALFYRSEAQYLREVSGFVRGALARGDHVLVMVPGSRAGPLREVVGSERVTFADMAAVGRNPGRIIPAVRAFAKGCPAGRICVVGEAAWPDRSERELVEALKHEALVNRAFCGTSMTALCPCDMTALPAGVLAAVEQTHPVLTQPGRLTLNASRAYLGPEGMPPGCLEPLPEPPPRAEVLRYRTNLRPVRSMMEQRAVTVGLSTDRTADLVLAVSELAANTLRHTQADGMLRVWQADGELLCEICDQGTIADPLAGRDPPAGDAPGGCGLWVVNQLCDLVEMRSGSSGTTIRLHIRLQR